MVTPDDETRQLRAETERKEAEAQEADLKAKTAEVALEEARARREQAEADAQKAKAEARKTEAEIEQSIASAPEVLELEKKKKLAALQVEIAQSERALGLSVEQAHLDEQKKVAETRQAIATAEKAALEAKFPVGQAQPLEGKTELDAKAGFVAVLVAQDALHGVAVTAATAIDKKYVEVRKAKPADPRPKVLLVDSLETAQGDLPRLEIEAQFDLLESGLTTHREAIDGLRAEFPVEALLPTSLLAIRSAVSLLADIGAYFRTDYSVKGIDVELQEYTAKAIVAGRINEADVHILSFTLIREAPIIQRYATLLNERTSLDSTSEQVRSSILEMLNAEVKTLEERIAELNKVKSPTQDQQRELTEKETELKTKRVEAKRVEDTLAEWTTFAYAFDVYMKSVVTVAEPKEPPKLMLGAIRDYIYQCEISHLLFVKTAQSGGEAISAKSLWPWVSGRITYMGGATLTYVLSNTEGVVVTSDTITALRRVKYSIGKAQPIDAGDIDLKSVGGWRRFLNLLPFT